MRNSCKTTRAQHRHEELENAIVRLMRKKNLTEISVSDLCREANIPRRTFYRYYEDRDAVLDAIIEDLMTECNLEALFDFDQGPEAAEACMLRFFRFWNGEKQEILKLLLENGQEGKLTRFVMNWAKKERIGIHRPAYIQENTFTLGTVLISSGFFALLTYWVTNGCQETPEEMARSVLFFMTKPIFQIHFQDNAL